MPYIPSVNTVQAELIYTWDGQFCETVLHYVPTVLGWTSVELAELGAALVALWNVNIKPSVAATLALTAVTLTDLNTQTGEVYNVASGLPIVGTNASPSLPNNVAIVLTKRTALRGRSYRGRIYHPGLTEGAVVNNNVPSPGIGTIIAGWNAFLSVTTSSHVWKMVVMSRYNANSPRVTATTTQVTGLTSDGSIDSQRRRLPGRGA